MAGDGGDVAGELVVKVVEGGDGVGGGKCGLGPAIKRRTFFAASLRFIEIGRASCRDRV